MKGNYSLPTIGGLRVNEISQIAELFVEDVITLDQAKAQIEEKNIETLNRTIMQLKIKREKTNKINQ